MAVGTPDTVQMTMTGVGSEHVPLLVTKTGELSHVEGGVVAYGINVNPCTSTKVLLASQTRTLLYPKAAATSIAESSAKSRDGVVMVKAVIKGLAR